MKICQRQGIRRDVNHHQLLLYFIFYFLSYFLACVQGFYSTLYSGLQAEEEAVIGMVQVLAVRQEVLAAGLEVLEADFQVEAELLEGGSFREKDKQEDL